MWVSAKSIDGKKTVRINDVSRRCEVSEFRRMLVNDFDAPAERLALFFRGKQLVDDVTLFHYGINVNDTILVQVLLPDDEKPTKVNGATEVSEDAASSSDTESVSKENSSDKENDETIVAGSKIVDNGLSVDQSNYYKVGDRVDIWDPDYGGWVEATVRKITRSRPLSDGQEENLDLFDERGHVKPYSDDGHNYYVYRDGYEDKDMVKVVFYKLRPRSHYKLAIAHVNIGDLVLVNFNIEKETAVGLWYNAVITAKDDARRSKSLNADIHVSLDEVPLVGRKLAVVDQIYRLVHPVPINRRDDNYDKWMRMEDRARPACLHCGDSLTIKCKICSCCVCGGKDEPDKQPLCEECGCCYHIWCLKPPLDEVPTDDEWYCPNCKNDETEVVRRGEKLKESKKKAKMPSMASTCTRDWGKGMACVGRTKQCTIVSSNHFGPIPGIEVGSCWRYRMQAAEAGVHRPVVSGIHGSGSHGAYSIVLSGGYEEDEDNGEAFTYTGSGGRDLSGNKRTAKQSSDQLLTRTNKGLALNCAATFNDKKGAVASNWRQGKPVRVMRSASGKKHSIYCPDEGVRYDGIYKVTRYWPEKGKSGFIVWRFEFRRDDENPAPWTKAGKRRIKELGLTIQYPEGYHEAKQAAEKNNKDVTVHNGKRSHSSEEEVTSEPKRTKSASYRLPSNIKVKIEEDVKNERIWNEVLLKISGGHQVFIDEVKEQFVCICCQDLVQKPVMTPCKHIFCKACLDRSFKLDMRVCPTCRHSLEDGNAVKENKSLSVVLNLLFPGYDG